MIIINASLNWIASVVPSSGVSKGKNICLVFNTFSKNARQNLRRF